MSSTMHASQAKTTNTSSPATKTAESAQKAVHHASSPTLLPAWTNAWGDQPPAGLFLPEVGDASGLQTKLTIAQPGDACEQEADRMAEQVMRMAVPGSLKLSPSPTSLQRKCACGGTMGSDEDEECAECRQKRLALQRLSTHQNGPSTVPPIVNTVLNGGGGRRLDSATRSFMEPRFGRDFSQVRVHTDIQAAESAQAVNAHAYTVGRNIIFGRGQYRPETSEGRKLLAHELTHVVQQISPSSYTRPVIQRSPDDESADSSSVAAESAPGETPTSDVVSEEPTEENAPPNETPTPALIVEDSVDVVEPGQMKKSEFLAQLRDAVCTTAEQALAGTMWSAAGCPWIDYWFGYYGNRDSQQIERAIRRYAPETAGVTTASDYIPIICERVRRAIAVWSTTGEITGVPAGVSADLAGAPSEGGSGETSSTRAEVTSTSSPVGAVLFKGQEGGPREASSPQAIQAQLGAGSPLDGGVKGRMEQAFGQSFSQVRVHTDSKAAGLATDLNARAFTIGSNVAFGAGEYQPGTLFGDALIAHELAHVVQQGSANLAVAPMQVDDAGYNALEEDADWSAVGAVASLWSGAKGMLKDIARKVMPQLRSGLKLQRCTRGSQNCCCCVTSLQIQNISQIDTAERMGHSFDTVIGLSYSGSGSKKSCTLEWWEKTNVPYAPKLGQQPNVWHNMYQLLPTSVTFNPWNARTEPCPGNETVTITDPPSLGKTPGRTVTRTLEFRIVVNSGAGCTCGNSSQQVTARQILVMVNANPDWTKSEFRTPNPSP